MAGMVLSQDQRWLSSHLCLQEESGRGKYDTVYCCTHNTHEFCVLTDRCD